jgi:hypothetical protein
MRRGGERGWPGAVGAMLAALLGAGGCTGDAEPSSAPALQVYVDDYGYAADLALADGDWIDDWYLDAFHAARPVDDPVSRPAAALRALARGISVCPGHVTIVPRLITSCSVTGVFAVVRSGATITFDGCALDGGGFLDGAVDVSSQPQLSDTTCDDATVVDVTYTTTLTDLSYRMPGGGRLLIPSMNESGAYTRTATSSPTRLSVRTEGTIQRVDRTGVVTASHGVRGEGQYTFAVHGRGISYSVDGGLAISDRSGGGAVTATGKAVTLTSACCRPTGGSVLVGDADRTWAAWSFGPACGALRLNGTPAPATPCP